MAVKEEQAVLRALTERRITSEHLEEAISLMKQLNEQGLEPKFLLEILILRERLTAEEAFALLNDEPLPARVAQDAISDEKRDDGAGEAAAVGQFKNVPRKPDIMFGEAAVGLGFITQDQLQAAFRSHEEGPPGEKRLSAKLWGNYAARAPVSCLTRSRKCS